MRKHKRVKCFNMISSKTLKKITTSTWKAIIKEKGEEIINRETTTMKKWRFLREACKQISMCGNCGRGETTKLLKWKLYMIKCDSNYGKGEHVKCVNK